MGNLALGTALCLPSLDLDALLQGRTIVALSNSFRNPSHFLLYPVDLSASPEQLSARYHSEFLESLRPSARLADPDAIAIHAWAKSKTCRLYSGQDDLVALSQLTAWSTDYLRTLTQKRHKIFLLFLQVHRFSQPIELTMSRLSEDSIGSYINVPGTWSDQGARPLLSDETFFQRQKQLIKLSLPLHPELAPLQTALVAVRENSLGAMSLDRDLRYFLGWSRAEETQLPDSDLVWIQTISQVGHTHREVEYRNLVQESLLKLGFSNLVCDVTSNSNPTVSVSAGGFDLYCDEPYVVVGKCDTSNPKISHQMTSQLIHVGNTLLGREPFIEAIKILFVTGPLSAPAEQTARRTQMTIIRPETLQRLTELKAQHPGALDLLKLKQCLQAPPFGEASDEKVHQFIDETLQQIKLRSSLVKAIKTYLESTGQEEIGLDTICSAYSATAPEDLPALSVEEVHDLLIELSSPLAGYLGRRSVGHGKEISQEVFYLLRELPIEAIPLSTKTA